jgi:hypothetical protein
MGNVRLGTRGATRRTNPMPHMGNVTLDAASSEEATPP